MNPLEITGHEKRITFQLYKYWFALTGDRELPPLKDLNPSDIAPYKDTMVLIDLRNPTIEPVLQVVGQSLTVDIEDGLALKSIGDIPRKSLLSRITDHYLEVLANRTPISFDAEYENKAGELTLYRGIMLPFSDDGSAINFILGAIRSIASSEKEGGEEDASDQETPETPPEDHKGAVTATEEIPEEIEVSPLQDRMMECQALAMGQNPANNRSRKSLYRTLGALFDFQKAADKAPDEFQTILQSQGLKLQKRAPFTPALKLCFGQDFDKTRLTEYAAALCYARKYIQEGAELSAFIATINGGIKGCVKAERAERRVIRGKGQDDILEKSKKILKNMPIIGRLDVKEEHLSPEKNTDTEFCLILARKDGRMLEALKILDEKASVLDPILKRIAKNS